jgi:hypothetical protein
VGVEDKSGKGIERRELFKRSAVAAGAGALVWAAPRIETLGFAPANAASGIVVTSPATDDKNQNSGGSAYCAPGGPFTCCSTNWGSASTSQAKLWTFANPKAGCTEVVVQLIPWDCTASNVPDIATCAVKIVSQTGTCNCSLFSVLLKKSNNTIVSQNTSGPGCAPGSLSASFDCSGMGWDTGAKLAVQIQC